MAGADSPRALVVVGSSAGGIEALSTLVSGLPDDFAAPLVIAQHLDPSRPSHLQQILARRTALPVHMVTAEEHLEPGVIYVVPASLHVAITDDTVSVRENDHGGPRPSVDLLLSSAAQSHGEQLIAVILTGNGADGAAGAREVHNAGGTVIIQNPETAAFPAMPLSLAPTDVDIIANVENMGAILSDLTSGARIIARQTEERALRTFLDQLRERSGIDFTSYKSPTIMRRLQRRMVATDSERLADYIRYLQTHPEEYQRLVSSFLIKVTEFFRDAELFNYLRDQLLPQLIIEARDHDNELRFWSAGCATGEEAYSLAILVSDLLGDDLDQFNVRIFATDLDNDAVTFARRGIYPASALVNVPQEIVDRYFTEVNGEFEIKKQARSLTVFGQHDLGQRAPFPRIDLALCRNVLIYFTTELQKRALQLFAFSLRDNGLLVLGKAETTNPLAEYFTLEQQQLKIYRRQGDRILIPPARIRDTAPLLPIRTQANPRTPSPLEARAQRDGQRSRSPREKAEAILLGLPVGVVVVDRRYDIQVINGTARQLFGIHTDAVGEDFIHLTQSVEVTPLRAAIDAAFRGDTATARQEIAAAELATGEMHSLEIACYPQKLDHGSEATDAVLVIAVDVTERAQERRDLDATLARQQEEAERLALLTRRLADTNRQLLVANQDLSGSNIELRSANEEFLVASEEAQAATEEIETLNEELQATNEELETLNEELQATVEELNTTNDDLQARTVELQDLAVSLEAQRRDSDARRDRLEVALAGTADAIIIVSDRGEILLANADYIERFGGSLAAVATEDENGQPLPPEAMPPRRAARGESFAMIVRMRAVNGVWHRFEATSEPIRPDAPLGGIVTLREIMADGAQSR